MTETLSRLEVEAESAQQEASGARVHLDERGLTAINTVLAKPTIEESRLVSVRRVEERDIASVFARIRPKVPADDPNDLLNFDLSGPPEHKLILCGGRYDKIRSSRGTRDSSSVGVEESPDHVYHFDWVFTATDQAAQIYEHIQPAIDGAKSGSSVCIILERASGSGKSFTYNEITKSIAGHIFSNNGASQQAQRPAIRVHFFKIYKGILTQASCRHPTSADKLILLWDPREQLRILKKRRPLEICEGEEVSTPGEFSSACQTIRPLQHVRRSVGFVRRKSRHRIKPAHAVIRSAGVLDWGH